MTDFTEGTLEGTTRKIQELPLIHDALRDLLQLLTSCRRSLYQAGVTPDQALFQLHQRAELRTTWLCLQLCPSQFSFQDLHRLRDRHHALCRSLGLQSDLLHRPLEPL